ncbi:ABC transporter permease [Acuticoccus sp.]|uniref:ABC transporter permease n=1 Tax=Acuticoccus sp. TaxID=1904378 RepID=UPI003B52F6C3
MAVVLPVAAGLLGVLAPAFGLMPALGADRPGLHVFAALIARPGIVDSAAISAWTALAATLVSVAMVAVVLAAAYGTRALGLAERLLAPLLAVPHAAAALGFVALFAPSGLLLRLLSPWATGYDAPPDVALVRDPAGIALVTALVLKEVPFLFLMALAALGQTRARERVHLARSLGYGPMAAFLHGVWPLIYRQLRLPILAVIAFAASVVDVALIVGPTRPPPLAVRIVDELGAADLAQWLVGSAGALLLLALSVGLVLAWLAIERLAAGAARAVRDRGRRLSGDGPLRAAAMSLAALLAAIMAAALAALLVRSVAGYWPFPDVVPRTVSAVAWRERLPDTASTLVTTLVVALGATLVALPAAVALLAAGVRAGPAIYLPLVVPQAAFLFGLSVLVVAAGIVPGTVIVTLVHALFVLPYATIALSGPWHALDPRAELVAASLGAGTWRRLVVVRLAILAGPLCVAAALSVAVSVGLYLPTQLVGAGRVATVTTEAVSAATGGDRRLVAMLALVQLAIPCAAFALARAVPAVLFRHRRAMRPAAVAAG